MLGVVLGIVGLGVLGVFEDRDFVLELHDLHLVMLVRLLDVLSRLRKLLGWRFLSRCPIFALLVALLHLLQQDIDLFLVLGVFFLQFVLQELFLDESCLLLSIVRAFIPGVRLRLSRGCLVS